MERRNDRFEDRIGETAAKDDGFGIKDVFEHGDGGREVIGGHLDPFGEGWIGLVVEFLNVFDGRGIDAGHGEAFA
ncbi:hypothetical protein D3C86_2165650 [compost metagenome]